jgi:hypothetical protein|tara:strand:- start:51 stop:569 length:519 start_codon:yes stop_codon:yes gene_type:complete
MAKRRNSINLTLLKKFTSVLLLSLFLDSCASPIYEDSSTGTKTIAGGIIAGGSCAGIVDSMEVVAACSFLGSVTGAIAKWDSDFKVHKSYFVEHLIGAPDKPSITNWYNPNTKNSGIIKTTRTFYKDSVKCRTWESTIDITPSWPFNWIGSPIRRTNFGTACIMSDGKVDMQ